MVDVDGDADARAQPVAEIVRLLEPLKRGVPANNTLLPSANKSVGDRE